MKLLSCFATLSLFAAVCVTNTPHKICLFSGVVKEMFGFKKCVTRCSGKDVVSVINTNS